MGERKPLGQSAEAWEALWASQPGQQFRGGLALMFSQFPPFKAPTEDDYEGFGWGLRDLFPRIGVSLVIAGMERATRAAAGDKFHPSAGMVRAHAERLADLAGKFGARALPAKKFVPPTEEQLAQIREDIRNMKRGPAPEAPLVNLLARVTGGSTKTDDEPSAYGELGGGVA